MLTSIRPRTAYFQNGSHRLRLGSNPPPRTVAIEGVGIAFCTALRPVGRDGEPQT